MLGDIAADARLSYIGTGNGFVEFALSHKEASPTQHREEHGHDRRAKSYHIVSLVWG